MSNLSNSDTPQVKIGSGFGARSTADDVLADRDLTGTLALVTGGYSGLGLETTRALARAGARVVVPARRADVAREAVRGIAGVEVDELDLGDLESVRAFADRFLASGRTLDHVINSAGIMACPETRVGPGWETQFATNHLGHFALVNRLWPAIEPGGARVVSVSSRGHHFSGVRWDDVDWRQGYDKWQAYGQAKTANALFALHLDKLGRASGVRAFSLHPGGILTPLQRHLAKEEMIERGWIDENGELLMPEAFKTPEQGAATQVWAATSTRLDGLGGVYLEDCEVSEEVSAEDIASGSVTAGVAPWARDAEQAERLWALSAERTGVNAFAG
ncbi:SDR family NAD(P)-dependent oxidoreductase [Streptomyces niveiscabiei]|uniref:SDR family NAD(P)-dependent oxidoreductase n=1 Tax=Streptomyces niveiscabiei TaxID=164115 RepID=UPI0029B39DD1|nr:SDR family NAD(P)-dependent oxidoreductase [Streptomyces niveiscabiei]MDX3382570.1 SDR family NAD(P)-dependent oxidoreductase [Streptomyces niveiscabiei]